MKFLIKFMKLKMSSKIIQMCNNKLLRMKSECEKNSSSDLCTTLKKEYKMCLDRQKYLLMSFDPCKQNYRIKKYYNSDLVSP